jgi:hypothetical protein
VLGSGSSFFSLFVLCPVGAVFVWVWRCFFHGQKKRDGTFFHSSSSSPALRGYLPASVYAMLATHPFGATYRRSLAAE